MAGKGPAPKSGKTPIFAFRLKPHLREALEATADENQRPLSEEITARLIRSLREDREVENKYGNQSSYRMANVLGIAVSRAAARFPNRDWLVDPVVFDFVKESIIATLDPARPPDGPRDAKGAAAANNYSATREISRSIWLDIAEARQRDPLDPYRNIADELGEIISRPPVYQDEFDRRFRERVADYHRDRKGTKTDEEYLLLTSKEIGKIHEDLDRIQSEVEAEMIAEGKNPQLNRENF